VSVLCSADVTPGFDYARPTNLADAIALLEDRGQKADPLAGGTDLGVALRHGTTRPDLVVDLKGVAELAPAIEWKDGMLVINANTPMIDIEHDETIGRRMAGLVESAGVVGSVQIRNRATLAGNLCNASPAADTPPMLMALNASVVVVGPRGERRIAIDEFLTGYRQTVLRPGDVVAALDIPEPGPRAGTAFLKLGVRRAMEISIVCAGARLELGEDGDIAAVGIGLGSVAPTTIRPIRSEGVLLGSRPTPAIFAEAGERALAACSPIDDLRATAEYRRGMVPVLVRRALEMALDRVGVNA
jgi:CO/xanthine dehydrogenase FAD-binding subunit